MGDKIMERLRKYRLGFALLSLGFIVVGILFLAMRENAFVKIAGIFGLVIFVIGGVMLLSYFLKGKDEGSSHMQMALSVLVAVLGLLMMIFPGGFAGLFSLFLGIYMIIMGAAAAQIGYCRRAAGGSGNLASIIFGGVLVVLGLVMAINPFKAMAWFATLIGVVMIICGVMGIGLEIYYSQSVKKISVYKLNQAGERPIEVDYKDVK